MKMRRCWSGKYNLFLDYGGGLEKRSSLCEDEVLLVG
jgi:hypothetical protein